MDFFDNRYYKLNRLLLVSVGLWPYQSKRECCFRRVFVIIILASVSTTRGITLLSSPWTVDVLAEAIPQITIFSISVTNYITFSYYTKKVQVLLGLIEQNWNLLQTNEEISIMKETAERGRIYNIYSARFLYTGAILYNLSPLSTIVLDILMPLNQSRPLRHPYAAEYNVDSEKYYFPILLHMCIGSSVLITVLLSTGLMLVMKMQHACGLFRVAGYLMKTALSDNIYNDSAHHNKRKVLKKLTNGIKCHKRAIQFVVGVNDCYQWPNFLLLVFLVISITLSLFCTAAFADRWKERVSNLINVVAQIGFSFAIVYCGQQVIDESSRIFEEVYSSEWYDAPLTSRKLLLLIMRRSLISSTITLGNMFAISLEYYGTVIQASVAYFMTLFSLT